MSETSFKPRLGLWDATMIVAGSMIGSGIFIVSADITRTVGSAGWLVGIWLITALMTMCAAVSYGELSSMFPKAGGQYIYLKEAFNPLTGFLYGWSLFAVIQTGTIAAVGVAFSKFTAYLIPAVSEDLIWFDLGFLKVSPAQGLSICIIILLTFINTRGIQGGKLIQTSFSVIKITSLFIMIAFGFVMIRGDVWSANWTNAFNFHKLNADGSIETYTTIATIGAVASAMAGTLFSMDAWNNVTFIAGEIKNPKRNIGLSLFFGTLIVAVIYNLTNIMYTAVLPVSEIAYAVKDRVAVAASHFIFGEAGTILIAVTIMISTFSCNNGLILSGARVYYAMAKDGLFFRKAGTLNRFAVPAQALWAQCILACIWCLSGRYGDLLNMVAFAVILFYVITILAIFVLRKKMPDAERPYKAFGYPWLASIYIIMGSGFCTFLLIYKPKFTLPGLIITLIGIPIYYAVMHSKKKTT